MSPARLEHVNVTVSNPDATAEWLCSTFDWHIRWSGAAIHGGRSVHVGGPDWYVALYNPGTSTDPAATSYGMTGGLNHIAVVVDDLDTVEARVKQAGFATHSHANYEPGRRFYFHDRDGVEFEVVSYTG